MPPPAVVERPPRPRIKDLTPYDEVDLAKLGSDDLAIYFTYDGIDVGQTVDVLWIGADQQGNPVESGLFHDVDERNFDPVNKETVFPVPNEYVTAAEGGYAFFSFKPINPVLEQSMRAFCFVGVRPHRLEHMPVAQAPQSHNLYIDPSTLGAAGATFLVPPYQAMRAKDGVTLYFVGYESNGDKDETWKKTIQVTAQDVGQVLRWQVPLEQFDFISKGHADVYYEIEFADLTSKLRSPTQTFRIDKVPDAPPLLAPLEIEGYTSGKLDPLQFLDGLVLRITGTEQLMVSDRLLLHFNDNWGVQQLRIDLSGLESGVVQFTLPFEKFDGLDRIRLGYQVAREGVAYSGAVRDVELVVRRDESPLNVFFAEAEGAGGEFNAYLPALLAKEGAYIDLSAIELLDGETLEVYWEGRSALGNLKFTFDKVPEELLHIPPAAVAANMRPGNTEAERFPVYYKIMPEQHKSKNLNLRIVPLGQSNYPTLQCTPRRGTELHMSDIGDDQATLTLPHWPFMSVGQMLVITVSGFKGGKLKVFAIRNELVREAEVSNRMVTEKLQKTSLDEFDDGSKVTFHASVNFEGDVEHDNWTVFESSWLTLRK
ncbi:hypothetical protein [Pseudomonas sp. TWI628]|uniref:hypothetical protein n=1 Tax=Pseudomonas sp. TWI628 TaxID=3136788 RepID=UPI003209888D